MQNKNFLKLSLYECKFDKNSQITDFGNFKLSISFNSKTFTTDKININHTKFKSGKFFYFEIPQKIDDNQNITISAIGTSWMFFNSIICSCEINYKKNLSNFNDKKYWYSLKNKENNEIMQILISIWTEYSILDTNNDGVIRKSSKMADLSLIYDKSSFINNSLTGNITLTEKNELKHEKLNNTIIMRTQREENKNNNISSKGLLMHLYKDTNPPFLYQDNINKTTNNIILSTLSNANKKNIKNKNNFNNHSNNNNNTVRNNYDNSSPFVAKENLSSLLIGNNFSYINNRSENELDNNKIENEQIIALIEKYEKDGGDRNIVKNLWEQINLLKEKEKNLEKQQIKYNEAFNKLKEKNKILNKERQQLDYRIEKFKKDQNNYEQKNIKLTKYIKDFENNYKEFNTQEKIDNNNKEIFYNLNYYISTGNNLPLNKEIENNIDYDKIIITNSNELFDSLNIDKINNI